jgi:hypothetical protein
MVKVQMNKVGRTRPIFKEWHLDAVEVKYNDAIINENDVIGALQDEMAIGDWRPKFGRFRVEKVG